VANVIRAGPDRPPTVVFDYGRGEA
jgi:hypothetical protein